MMQRWRFTVVGILFCLLAFAASAHAECAWVLWAYETSLQAEIKKNGEEFLPPIANVVWTADRGFLKLAECEAVRGPRLRLWRKTMIDNGYSSSRTDGTERAVLFKDKPKKPMATSAVPPAPDSPMARLAEELRDSVDRTMFIAEFKCLPDTVDPRAPKGK